MKNLTIHNKTNQQWLLKPVMDGEYWSGPDTISIDPQQNKNYEITYRPLTMTLENKKHTVSVICQCDLFNDGLNILQHPLLGTWLVLRMIESDHNDLFL